MTGWLCGQCHLGHGTPASVLLLPGAAGHPSTADSSTSRPVVRRTGARRRWDVEAVVTAANTKLRGGGGVDGAVHAAAGLRLLQASLALAPCPPGGAVLTEAFDLAPVRWVIHAVGPIYQGPQDAATLTSAYTQALARADEVGATSVAFPSISTGAYGYPLAEAAAVSVQALCGAVTAVQSVLLVASSHRVQELWEQALEG